MSIEGQGNFLTLAQGHLHMKINLDGFNFDIVNFPFLDGDVPQRHSYGVYIYFNLFALPEHLCIILTSIIVTNS